MSDEGDPGAAGESETELDPSPVASPGVEPTQPLHCGAVLAGRYEIRKIIGRGGMGLVVDALDRTLGEAVAIKILRAEYAGERTWSERLAREVKLARQIHHPNVCRVFDFEQADGRVFLIMELTSHGSLRDEVRSGATTGRPIADRIADVRALAAGLAAIHDAGIIHRDVTPQNVLRMADGRVVLSDFGLATDSWENTTSVHGGTIAYMAPELLRGGRASVASDVWALGVVSHEIVFGERPHWRPGASEMSNPIAGRRLTVLERAVLEICRDCTAENPERRPRKVAEIAARLTEARIRRATWRRWGVRAAAAACVGIATMGGLAGFRRLHARGSPQAAVSDPLMIVPTGEPDDWSDKSKVLAEVPDKIRCTSLLPDHRTVRFVWGRPAHAEDVDTHTGVRKPSLLVPEAYAEGCPDVSPDGRRMVYTGHTPDNRAFAFVSTHADGSGGVPVVPIAEPTMNSDPTWLPDGQTFSYEADVASMAVFSLITNRSTILPRPTLRGSQSTFRQVVGNQIFVTAAIDLNKRELVGLHWPSLTEEVRFRLPGQALDVTSHDGHRYYCSLPGRNAFATLVEVDPMQRRAENVGAIPDQSIRYPTPVADGLLFASVRFANDIALRTRYGALRQITWDGDFWEPQACGQDIVAIKATNGTMVVVRLDRHGRIVGQLTTGPSDGWPACSADGRDLYYVDYTPQGGVKRCGPSGCRTLLQDRAFGLTVSPDDKRLGFVTFDNRGDEVRWIGTNGGAVHDVTESETNCAPGWSSTQTLWVSRRRGKDAIWTEVDADSGRTTGRVVPGTRDCADGIADPASPGSPEVGTIADRGTQLRLLPARYLPNW